MMPSRHSIALAFLLCLTAAAGISSCALFDKTRARDPEKIALRFLTHVNKMEFADAARYATDKTRSMLEIMDQLVAVSGQEVIPSGAEIVMCGCETNGDEAICNYTSNGKALQLKMVRKDGRWLADMKKEMPPQK